MATLEAIQQQIKQNAKLPGGAERVAFEIAITGQDPTTSPALIAATNDEAPESTTTTVGPAPEGFGQTFIWGREHPQALLAVWISATDIAGVSIQGLQAGDRIVITSATGLASFAEDTQATERGIIGLIASAASVGAGLAGFPEAIPFIEKAEQFAKEQYTPENTHTKVRDAFGVDPSPGLLARQEGGVLVCLPEAGGTYYSGSSEKLWIKGKSLPDIISDQHYALPGTGVRVPENNPDHVHGAFFLRREEVMAQTPRTTFVNGGQAYLIAWDGNHSDNAGFYKVFVRLEKGIIDLPPIP